MAGALVDRLLHHCHIVNIRGNPDPRPIDRLRNAAATGATSTLLSELARTKESLDRGDHF